MKLVTHFEGEKKEKLPAPTIHQWDCMIAEYHQGDELRALNKRGTELSYSSVEAIVMRWKRICNIKDQTLRDHIKGKYANDVVVGRPSSINPENVILLGQEIEKAQTSGLGHMTLPQATAILGRLATETGTPYADCNPCESTVQKAIAQVPNLHRAQGIRTTESRLSVTADPTVIQGFFTQLEKIYELYPLLKILPTNHGNFDETGYEVKVTGNELCFWIKNPKKHFMKARTLCMTSGSSHVSGCSFELGDGYLLPNGYIVAGANVQCSWYSPNEHDRLNPYLKPLTRQHFLDLHYSVSESGMTDQVLYENMLVVHFFPAWRQYADAHGGKDQPLLFIVDFPETHRPTPTLIHAMFTYSVIMCTLPHNSSTLLQWLDLKFFKILKTRMRKFFLMLHGVTADHLSYLARNKKGFYQLYQYTNEKYATLTLEQKKPRSRSLGLSSNLGARTIILIAEYITKMYLLPEHGIEACRISGIFPLNPELVLSKITAALKHNNSQVRTSVRNVQKEIVKSIADLVTMPNATVNPAVTIAKIKLLLAEAPDTREMMVAGIYISRQMFYYYSYPFLLIHTHTPHTYHIS